MYRVYGMAESGNCYKVKLLLAQLGQSFEWIETDVTKGETRTPGIPATEPERQGADAGNIAGRVPSGIERDPVLSRRGHAILAR